MCPRGSRYINYKEQNTNELPSYSEHRRNNFHTNLILQNVINLTALKVFPEAERYESIKQSKLCLTKEQMLGK